jgi:dihydroorotate dehydrogenase
MPDWSYQTLFRPLLFRLPPRVARGFTLASMGGLSSLPGGTIVIRTMGHMELAPILRSERLGVPVTYPIGLSGGVDPQGMAAKALSPFGFGYYEIGPVTVRPIEANGEIHLEQAAESILYPVTPGYAGVESTVSRLRKKQGHRLPHMLRLRPMPGVDSGTALEELGLLAAKLSPYAAGFFIDVLEEPWSLEEQAALLRRLRGEVIAEKPCFLYVPLHYDIEQLGKLISLAELKQWTGFVVGDTLYVPDRHALLVGKEGKVYGRKLVAFLRRELGAESVVIAASGIHEPQDALELMEDGADYVQLHSGLVYSGPGLPKRINEAVIHERIKRSEAPEPLSFWHSWGWMCLLGIGMVIGGILAWIVAATSVLLPYDEEYLGLTREQLSMVSGRLVSFMSHDRITLAGTMISIGILYYFLGAYGLRERQHWAKTASMCSGIVGFSSFFLYLGYGYFDPLHAAAAAILLPMFIMAMRGTPDEPTRERVNLRNNPSWRMAQWGQLLLVSLGFALAIGGLTISYIGITTVFVPEDLAYLGRTADEIAAIHPRLVPLIAHDRAGFGGALLSDAIALLTAALWGIAEGRRWVWWMLLLGGLPGFIAGFGVHAVIGYTDVWHLLPAAAVLALYVAGLLLVYPYMMKRKETTLRRVDHAV